MTSRPERYDIVVYELWSKGYKDMQIAAATGTHINTVRLCRKRLGYRGNPKLFDYHVPATIFDMPIREYIEYGKRVKVYHPGYAMGYEMERTAK